MTDKTDQVTLPDELLQVVNFMGAEESQHHAVLTIYEAIEAPLKQSWETLPASAQNVMDSFEQFQAVVAYTLIGPTGQVLEMVENNDKEGADTDLDGMLTQLFTQGIKMMVKDLKAARRNPSLKNELKAPFLN